MKSLFISSNYSWQKSISLCLSHWVGEVLNRCFVRLFFVWLWVCTAPVLCRPFVSNFADDFHNHQFSNPCCGTQFACDDVVIQNQHISFVFGLCHCCGWSAGAGPATSALSSTLKMYSAFNWAIIHGSLTVNAFQTCTNLCLSGVFHSKKISHHSLPSTYIHIVHHFVLLLCWTHVTGWSNNGSGGAGQCCYPVGKAI